MSSTPGRRYPDNEVRVAVFIDPANPFDSAEYHDISKGQKPAILEDIDDELWSQLCDYWPCPSKLQSTRYGSCWFFMFMIYFSCLIGLPPYGVAIRSLFYACLFWSLLLAWTIGMFYSLKVVKRKIVEEYGPATRDHIASLAPQFQTEAGYFVDYGVDGSMAYARFQKFDRSDFEHRPPINHGVVIGLVCLLVVIEYLVVALLCSVLLFCPVVILLLSEMGESGLEQRMKNSSEPHVLFSDWVYFNPQYPQTGRIIFSSEQRTSLGMEDNNSMLLKVVVSLGYLCFLIGAFVNPCWDFTLERLQKSKRCVGAAAVCSSMLTGLALVPILKLFQKSPLCGPYFIDLPFERRYSSDKEHYQFYGTKIEVHEDTSADCVLGQDFYWLMGLGASNLAFLLFWFLKQRSYIRKRHLVAMTEENLGRGREDCELHDTQSSSDPMAVTGNEGDPSTKQIV